ncbi:MAG: ABC transporter permease [Chitinispirillaceae bacterium]|nr:ABC transporter permease [Chitinispirillaceae bacterium]
MTGIIRFIELTGETAVSLARASSRFCCNVYRFSSLTRATFSRSYLIYRNPGLTMLQAFGLGVESLPLVSVIALFLGSETVIQAVYQMGGIVPMRYLGVLVCKSLTTELAPVVISMVVAGRVATGIAAEIGSMKTTEQLDAMQVLSLDPVRYLIMPKTIACIIMLPVLVIWGEFIALLGSIITAALSVDITMHEFLSGLRLFFDANDLYVGVIKTVAFGAIIALTGAYFGFEAKGGAEGVGNATTRAVITAAVLILIFDFIIAFLVL